MTKEELRQYRSIVAELEELSTHINRNTVRDTVTGSDRHFPYIKHTMIVTGIKPGLSEDMKLLKRLEKQKEKIELFVNSIDNSETRRIFYYRYIYGDVMMNWQQIAFKIGRYDESYARKKHNAYMENERG